MFGASDKGYGRRRRRSELKAQLQGGMEADAGTWSSPVFAYAKMPPRYLNCLRSSGSRLIVFRESRKTPAFQPDSGTLTRRFAPSVGDCISINSNPQALVKNSIHRFFRHCIYFIVVMEERSFKSSRTTLSALVVTTTPLLVTVIGVSFLT